MIKKQPKGSVLLVAMLVMGILMVITLGLTDLIIREMRLEADVSKAGKAYYAAEAGIEEALLAVHQGLPGVEKDNVEGAEFAAGARYQYSIHGRSKTLPDLTGVDYGTDLQKTFQPLRHNESITIPMFYTDAEGEVKHIKNFYVAYYMQPIDLSVKSEITGLELNDFDVLRWKIFGLTPQTKRTESISDYISAGDNDSAQIPRCFGTKVDSSDDKCKFIGQGDLYMTVDHKEILACSLIEARTYYKYNPDGSLDKSVLEQQCHSISGFFTDHEYNYLTLTNAVNLDMIKKSKISARDANLKARTLLATIYYKIVVLDDDELPLNNVKITSVGNMDDIEQAIEVSVGREQFLPVFNFSLYRFDADK